MPREEERCPIIIPTKLLGDTWVLLIIKALLMGAVRFNEIADAVPTITKSTLSGRLKLLSEQGIVIRIQHDDMPVRVEYHLTSKGIGLKKVIAAIEEYGNTYLMEG